ncbi:MAG: glycosyltransferase family 4 protein [bacterium]|nr:glycosyltransferase family 4 protein [bacterium]
MTRFPYVSSWGGEESHTLTLAKHFREKGYEVIFMGSCRILLEKFKELGFLTRKVWGGKMMVTPWEMLKSFFIFPFIRRSMRSRFEHLCRQYEVKALYCLSLNEKLFLSPLAVQKGIPVTWVEHQEIRNWLSKNWWKSRYQNNAQDVMIVPISKNNEHKLKNELQISSVRIKEIVNGVNLKELLQLKRKTKKGFILAANRMIPKKGLMDLLEAANDLTVEKKNLQFTLLGEGEEEEKIKQFARKHFTKKQITIEHFLEKENWFNLLLQADIYVSCARDSNETFSLSTAEAMAAGCKVVVTKCSGIADYLVDSTEAFLAKGGEPEDLKKKILKALSSSEQVRTNARRAAQEKFDQKRMLAEYESLILREV